MPERPLTATELLAVVELWKRTGRTVEARFSGTSMAPTIPSGSLLRLRCGAPLEEGQVAAFVRDGRLIVHRLVARHATAWLARGDALAIPDAPLPPELPFAGVEAVYRDDAWIESPSHESSILQRAVLALCSAAMRITPRGARLLIAALRRLRPRPVAAAEALPR